MFKEWWANKNDLIRNYCLQRFDAVGWAAGRASGLKKKLSGEVLAWLSVCSEMQTCIWPSWCHCHSLCLASVKSRLVLPFWNRPTRVVLEKGPLNGCVCVCYQKLTNKKLTSQERNFCNIVLHTFPSAGLKFSKYMFTRRKTKPRSMNVKHF